MSKNSNKERTEKKEQPNPKPNAQVVVHKYPSLIEWLGDSFGPFKDWALRFSNKKSVLWIASYLYLICAV